MEGLEEIYSAYKNFSVEMSAQTRSRLIEATVNLRYAKAMELLAASIDRIANDPIEVRTSTVLSGTLNVKEIK